MKEVVIKIGIIILKIIYAPMKLLKTKSKIVYISRQFDNETLDFSLLKSEIKKLDGTVQNVVLTKRMKKGIVNSISYMGHMLKQMYHIATAKVVVLDSYCIVASVLKHKKQTQIIQMWHAMGAIKKFGHQTIGKPSGADPKIAKIMCMHKNYNFVLCPSTVTKKYYCEAFNVSEDKIKYIGMPRIDYILQSSETEAIYNEYPELRNKINVIYVPTFRKGKKIKFNKLINAFDTDKYNLIIKVHPLDRKQYKHIKKPGIIFEEKFKTYDLFKIADRVITDYSSLGIEASLLDKPIYFYTYDIKEYKEDPGLNFNFEKEKIGKYAAQTPGKILELLEEQYDYSVLNDFRDRYITVNTNNCANRLSKYILELMNNEYRSKAKETLDTDGEKKLTV